MRVNANRTARLLQNKTILNTRKQETQNVLHLLDKQMFKKVDLEGKQKREREREREKRKRKKKAAAAHPDQQNVNNDYNIVFTKQKKERRKKNEENNNKSIRSTNSHSKRENNYCVVLKMGQRSLKLQTYLLTQHQTLLEPSN